MTDRSKKISELTAVSSAVANDVLVVVTNTATTPVAKKITVGNLFANVAANTTFSGRVNVANTISVNGSVVIAANGAWIGNSTGLKGEVGSKGDKGELGTTGSKGDKGEYGVDGTKGEKGDSGSGSGSGTKGDKGEAGAAGAKGEAGAAGAKGEAGAAGAKGDTGSTGAKGDTGAGTKGDKGDATGGIVMPVDEDFTVTTSHTVITDHVYELTTDFVTNIDIGGSIIINAWSQRNETEIEVNLFADYNSGLYTYLTGLTVGRDAEVTYASTGGSGVVTSTVSQVFTSTGQSDPDTGWVRLAGRILGTLPTDYVSDPGITSVNFPVTTEPTSVLTYDSLGKIVVATNTDLTISTRSVLPSASPAINATSRWVFRSDGRLTIPGAIAVPDFNTTWTYNITAVALGAYTDVTIDNEIFGEGDAGQIRISGVTGTTEVNGDWYYEAVDVDQIRLFEYADRAANTDSTQWTAYISGGIAENIVPGTVNVHVSSSMWSFKGDGSIAYPNISTNSRTGSADALVFNKTGNQKAIATQSGNATSSTVERLVIVGGDSYRDPDTQVDVGEGGDIYLWAGRGANGGDIKIDAGESTGLSGQEGGTIKIRGGYSANGTGGFANIEAGDGVFGGDINLFAGSGSGGSGATIRLHGGGGEGDSNNTSTVSGDIEIIAGVDAGGTSDVGIGNIKLITQRYSGQPVREWKFDTTGTLTLPAGGIVVEEAAPIGSANTITLKPYGGTDDDQRLLVYPTQGTGEGNHLHLTSGNLAVTSLFLGNDNQYVRTQADGSIIIGTDDTIPDDAGNGNRWIFGNNGITMLPGGTEIGAIEEGYSGLTTADNTGFIIGANSGAQVWEFNKDGTTQFPNDAIRSAANVKVETLTATLTPSNWDGAGGWNQGSYTDLATTGGTGTGLTVDVAAGGSGYINIDAITIHTPGSGYVAGDVITITNENSLSGTFTLSAVPNVWTFSTDGKLTLPGAVAKSTVAKTGGEVGTETAIDLTKSINKLQDGSYTLADGVEGQILYLVHTSETTAQNVTVDVVNGDGANPLHPFRWYNGTSFSDGAICTLLFTDGSWKQTGGAWD